MTQRIKIKGKNKREKIESILNEKSVLENKIEDIDGIVTVAFINFWSDGLEDFCQNYSKIIEKNIKSNQRPKILFCSVCGDVNLAIRTHAKVKIYCLYEPLTLFDYGINMQKIYQNFDIILSSKPNDLEKNMLRFPLWLSYKKFAGFEISIRIILSST